jgi:phosphate-selective porin OprO/OprP
MLKRVQHRASSRVKHLTLVLLLLGLAPQVAAQGVDPGNVLIENVYIALEGAEDEPVNLLVLDNKLKLVSRDQIPLPEGCVALDAAGGFLIGNLALGESPSFIILDADPRLDLEVLLDTQGRAVFAVYEGELRKNTLQYATSEILVSTPVRKGWHAYTPPPVALPTHYGESAAWNHWTTKNTANVLFGVLALDRQYWLSQNDDSEQQVGSLDELEGGEIRDFRLGLYGTLNYFSRPWGYTVVIATNAFDKRFEVDDQDHFKALDYRLDIPLGNSLRLGIGKQKEPISMERTMTLIDLPMQERSSAADAMLRSRNFGVLLSGNALDRRMSWAGGVFNDFIDTDVSFDDGAMTFAGRVTWLPFITADESNLVHLGLGASRSDGNNGFHYRAEPEFNKSPFFVDSGFGDADGIDQLALETSWRRGPFWLAAEHVETFVDSPIDGDLDFSGYYVTASWIVTGEMREYKASSGTFGRVPISRSAYQDGPGAWEIATRWSGIDLNDGPVSGGEMDILSLAVSWWLSTAFNVNVNYRYVFNERDSLDGEASGLALRVLLKLQ